MEELLVEEYRGGILECIHNGHICGVSDDGNVKYYVGDVDFVAFLRSSAKPIQAIPVLKRGLDKKYNLTEKETTIFAASHRAQSWHVEALESIMSKVGISEDELVCLPTYPLSNDAKEALLKESKPKRRIYHNCSGKHLGILTLCRDLGCSTDDYWDIKNPAQQEILRNISIVSDYPVDKIKVGTDGCGVPVFAMPLKYLAKAYMRLACPDLIEDKDTRDAVIKITGLMNKYPKMISGTDLICSLLNEDPNIVAKGGSKGVYCFGLREERLGFSLKVMDGSEEEWPLIVAAILEKINYKNKETIERLYRVFPKEIKNDNNKIVGCSEVKFNFKTI